MFNEVTVNGALCATFGSAWEGSMTEDKIMALWHVGHVSRLFKRPEGFLPCKVILRWRRDGNKTEYAVHFATLSVDEASVTYHTGHYTNSYDDALGEFCRRETKLERSARWRSQ